ncbi:HlyD family efflux transporter periplasmic adaptor subunit [Pseudomonas sp. HY7a-MNA-CIBAN-0227]|uniref:HlyD family secretion protein n=1 Tax=Pseudomonas sp. HY7a-MNA-CIBAN-0227 TaxID=3140474 RepID=UPI00332FC34A
MTKETPLFRRQALESKQVQWLGEIVLIRPVSFAFLTFFSSVIALLVVMFFVFGNYTKRSTVTGQLIHTAGQIKVHSPQYGVILEKFVQEDQLVNKGMPLFKIDSERYSGNSDPVQAAISDRLKQRHESLQEELEKIKQVQREGRNSLESKLTSLRQELSTLSEQTSSQKQLVSLAKNASSRYQGLMEKGYISMDQLQQRQAELIGQQQTLQSLSREGTAVQQQFAERYNELSALSALHANQLASISRVLSSVDQELVESEAKRLLIIHAPIDGIATAVLGEVGQAIDGSRPLLSIVPRDSRLQAELYARSKTIGFIKAGDTVRVRYSSYPYQKFGQHKGIVKTISKTTLSAGELAAAVGVIPKIDFDREQIYRIRVELDKQEVLAYGEARELQGGMLLEADILQETRHLYEWVLEPLYSLTGKL